MKRLSVVATAVWLCSLGLVAQSQPARPGAPQARPVLEPQTPAGLAATPESATQTIKRYCIGCHNDRGKAGGVSLEDFDVAASAEHIDTAERIVRKLRLGALV